MPASHPSPQDSFLRRNGLGLALLLLTVFSFGGQLLTGHAVYNRELIEYGQLPLSLFAYLSTGHLVSATFENWESEFLQMGMYVLLTVWLRRKGSAESRPMSSSQEHERIEQGRKPWAVRAGGWWKALYGQSLTLAFFVLFAVSFALHLEGSWRRELAVRAMKAEEAIALLSYAGSANFWFESFQNWQSEFLSVLALVVLSIWLRQKDSPQSKPIEAPHAQTGV